MSQPIRGQGGHLIFPISPKNTNLVEDVEILLPVKFVEFCSAVLERCRECESLHRTAFDSGELKKRCMYLATLEALLQ